MTQQPSKWAPPSPTIRVGVLGLLAAFLLACRLPSPRAPRPTSTGQHPDGGLDRRCEPRRHGRRSRASSAASAAPAASASETRGRCQARLLDLGRGPNRRQRNRPRQPRRHGRRHGFISDTGRRTQGIAVDANHVYWTRDLAARRPHRPRWHERRAELHHDERLRGHLRGSGVAVDAHHVYWTQVEAPFGVSAIGRANLDGTNVQRSFIPDIYGAGAVAVDAEHIYWTRPSRRNRPRQRRWHQRRTELHQCRGWLDSQ